MLEFDLTATADDEALVWHDPTLSPPKCPRAPDAGLLVPATKLEVLRRIDCDGLLAEFPQQRRDGGSTRLMTLTEALRLPGRLNIETKVHGTGLPHDDAAWLTRLLIKRVQEADAGARVTLQSFDWRALAIAHAEALIDKVSKYAPVAGQAYAAVKDTLIQGVTNMKRREALGAVVEDLRKQAGVQVLLRAPKIQVAAEGPSRGPANAKVTIVEFSDFQCPFCSKAKKTVDEVMAKYDGKVRLVFRDFPLDFHDKAQKASEAGQCANDQGKFWAMHDWMFDNQQSLDVDALKGAAKTLGLDSAKFDECLTSGKHAELVKKNLKAGQEAGVRGTPAFFINGSFLNGAQPLEKFVAEIDRALAE